MRLGDTIAACGTGSGGGERAVIRVSGPGALGAAGALVVDGVERERGVRRARIGLAGAGWFWGLVLVMPGPGSFTGEDVVELVVPGGGALVGMLVEALCGVEGVRLAEAGEFSARGYLNGRMTVEEAEGVGALIAATSGAEHAAALRVMRGEAGAGYRRVADEIAGVLSLVEAGIDFTEEEDVVAIGAGELVRRLGDVERELAGWVGGSGGVEREGAVVLAGEPNAGKSTLFNALLGRERSVVSDEAGTTRDAVREALELEGDGVWGVRRVELIDPAGLDADAGGGIDAMAQARAREAIGEAGVVVWCDPRGVFEGGGGLGGVLGVGLRDGAVVVRVRTKADLVLGGGGGDVAVCALDGFGLGALRRAIGDAALRAAGVGGGEGAVLARHRGALGRALEGVRGALEAAGDVGVEEAGSVRDVELVAQELRGALDAVGEVSGAITPDDVIGRVFSTFCVGK